MKKYLTIVYFILSILIWAQEKLVVEYESKMIFDLDKMEVNLQIPNEAMKKQILNSLAESMGKPSYHKLTLTPTESIFTMVEKITNDQPQENSGIRLQMMASGSGDLYKNLNENLQIKELDMFGKPFLVTDSLKKYDWKITNETKEILGYEVRKAKTKLDENVSVVAWYAPKLAYKNGPQDYHGLPGLILELVRTHQTEKETTQSVFTATSLSVDSSTKEIQRPSKGKKVTSEEFQAFQEEQIKKMQEMYEGSVEMRF